MSANDPASVVRVRLPPLVPVPMRSALVVACTSSVVAAVTLPRSVPPASIHTERVALCSSSALTAPLWELLSEIEPALWRGGKAYPASEPAMGQLLADGEVDISFAFNPGRASAEIAAGNLTDTVRTFTLAVGTIGNASFLAIPVNSSVKEGAQVIADLVLSPEVQARAQDPAVLGFQTVLNLATLAPEDRARFDALDLGVATLSPDQMAPALLEPHASWAAKLSDDWQARYGVAK